MIPKERNKERKTFSGEELSGWKEGRATRLTRANSLPKAASGL